MRAKMQTRQGLAACLETAQQELLAAAAPEEPALSRCTRSKLHLLVLLKLCSRVLTAAWLSGGDQVHSAAAEQSTGGCRTMTCAQRCETASQPAWTLRSRSCWLLQSLGSQSCRAWTPRASPEKWSLPSTSSLVRLEGQALTASGASCMPLRRALCTFVTCRSGAAGAGPPGHGPQSGACHLQADR